MNFLVYSRAASVTSDVDDTELDERHWQYMDRYADRMTARGPLLERDREIWAGSVHIVDLPNLEAAHDFVSREPYNEAGLYAEHSIWRFENLIGQTMWEFGTAAVEPRYFVVTYSAPGGSGSFVPVASLPPELRDRLIVYGELRDAENGHATGTAVALQARDRDSATGVAAAVLRSDTQMRAELHDWEFGGRR